ncbi:nuclear transport factor 2 family protein [Bacteroidota bacterium]
MKILISPILIIVISILALYGCQKSESVLTDIKKSEIEESVKNAFNDIIATVNDHDVNSMMEYYWNNENFAFVRNGIILQGWDDLYKIRSAAHSNPENQSFTMTVDQIKVNVYTTDMAMVSAIGTINNLPSEEGTISVSVAATYLMQKINNRWIVIHGHTSAK